MIYSKQFKMSQPKHAMKAKFATICSECGDKIERGKEISKNSAEKWVHKHCAEEIDGLP